MTLRRRRIPSPAPGSPPPPPPPAPSLDYSQPANSQYIPVGIL